METIIRLADSQRDEPLLISQLTRIAILQIGLEGLWQGLIQHQWSNAQLAMFQSALQRMDFLSSGLLSLKGERALFNDTFERAIADPRVLRFFFASTPSDCAAAWSTWPRCFLYEGLISVNRTYEEQVFPVINLAKHRVDPRKADSIGKQLAALHRTPYNIFAAMLVPAVSEDCLHFARTQTEVDQAMIACGLERYRLAHGQFPENLDALVPQFITKLPNDVMNGQPLKYRQTGDGGFVLYSVGWNQIDDGGEVALLKGSNSSGWDFKNGDWVWFSQPQLSASERK